MLKLPTLKQPVLLLALSLALLLPGCDRAEIKTTPDPARFERIGLPIAPAGEATCDGEPCLSDRQTGVLLNDLIDRICTADDRLAWLSDYYLKTELGPSCPSPTD